MALEAFCRQMQEVLAGAADLYRKIEKGRELMSELTDRSDWFQETLGRIVLDREFLDRQKASIWSNEYTLFLSPDREFRVLAYLWDAHLTDTIHDHGSWGIIGALTGRFTEETYERMDDGKREGHALLRERACNVLEPGGTIYVLPQNEGIHRMSNDTDDVGITINVYGKTLGRGFVQFFYPEKHAVSRVYSPRTHKEVLGIRALGAMNKDWSRDLLSDALRKSNSPFIRRECEIALAGRNRSLE